MNLYYHFSQHVSHVLDTIKTSHTAFGEDFSTTIAIADPRFGHFQINSILPYAKKLGQNPRPLAETLIHEIRKNISPEIARFELSGPGFINITLTDEYILNWLNHFSTRESLQEETSCIYSYKTVIIDYSSPNTAKQMHVGHLRSLVIGEALQRILKFNKANIIKDNHLGDWGTQFGILLMQIKAENYDLKNPTQDPIEDLEALYKRGSERFKTDEYAQKIARDELVKLQNNDPLNKQLWEEIIRISYASFNDIYQMFGVTFDQIQGESFYNDQLERIYQELSELKLAQISDGALVVFHPEHPRFSQTPFIIRKADGASNYGSTDLATALYHVEKAHADALLYVVDARQQDHFEQLFLTLKKWFLAKNYPFPILKHISFGTVLGEDGKAIKTRSGESIKLKDLITEAKQRALNIVQSKSPHLSLKEQTTIANIIGISALQYADLCQNRSSDYLFSWDKMLSLEGNTAPYLLYAVARIHSILKKLPDQRNSAPLPQTLFETVQEKTLAQHLVLFPHIIQTSVDELRPHPLCTYLYELAGHFSTFYAIDKILIDNIETRQRRILLAKRTLLILETGLDLLGLKTLEKM